jgi:protein-tyrosine kinase
MERIKAALDLAREQRDDRYLPDGTVPERTKPRPHTSERTASPEQKIVYTQTRVLNVSPDHLRRHRVISGPTDPVAAHYSVMRTRVMQAMRANDWRALVVTGPNEGAGKTLTAVNLAISMARETNHSILLVDLDLRRPSVRRYLTEERLPGLSDYILDNRPIPELLFNPGIDRLVVLPGHRPVIHSAEMLSSAKMVNLVEDITHRYPSRLVIFDMPPILVADDVLAFSPYFDAVLLVIGEGDTRRGDLAKAVELLAKKPLLGTVLNRGAEQPTGYGYY